MSDFLSVFFDVVLPVVLIVTAGFAATRLFRIEAGTLNSVAYYVFGPAFVFTQFVAVDIAGSELAQAAGMFWVAALVTAALALLAGRWLRLGTSTATALLLVAVFPNVGNFGLAMVEFQYGPRALPIGALYLVLTIAFAFVLGVGAVTWEERGWRGAVTAALTSPMIIAVYAAVAVRLLGLTLPTGIERGVSLLGTGMIPTMLITLGATLAAIERPTLDGAVWTAAVLKLGVMPVLAAALVPVFGLGGLTADVGVLQAAMPSAVFAVLISVEHEVERPFVATSVLVTTLISIITLPIVLVSV